MLDLRRDQQLARSGQRRDDRSGKHCLDRGLYVVRQDGCERGEGGSRRRVAGQRLTSIRSSRERALGRSTLAANGSGGWWFVYNGRNQFTRADQHGRNQEILAGEFLDGTSRSRNPRKNREGISTAVNPDRFRAVRSTATTPLPDALHW